MNASKLLATLLLLVFSAPAVTAIEPPAPGSLLTMIDDGTGGIPALPPPPVIANPPPQPIDILDFVRSLDLNATCAVLGLQACQAVETAKQCLLATPNQPGECLGKVGILCIGFNVDGLQDIIDSRPGGGTGIPGYGLGFKWAPTSGRPLMPNGLRGFGHAFVDFSTSGGCV